jgi:hypothetical protein
LFEAPAELIDRREKRDSECASEVGARNERVGASTSGLEIKWAKPSAAERSTKRINGLGERRGGKEYI